MSGGRHNNKQALLTGHDHRIYLPGWAGRPKDWTQGKVTYKLWNANQIPNSIEILLKIPYLWTHKCVTQFFLFGFFFFSASVTKMIATHFSYKRVCQRGWWCIVYLYDREYYSHFTICKTKSQEGEITIMCLNWN